MLAILKGPNIRRNGWYVKLICMPTLRAHACGVGDLVLVIYKTMNDLEDTHTKTLNEQRNNLKVYFRS